MAHAKPVARGCGTRQKGGCYFEAGLSPVGKPLEHFLFCPPIPLPDGMELCTQGIELWERDGVWHIFDWVGENHYPNVLDFTEEIRRFGLSRRIPKNTDFSKLTKESLIFLVHPRAIIENWIDYVRITPCPKQVKEHDQMTRMEASVGDAEYWEYAHSEFCIGHWAHDIEGGEYVGTDGVQVEVVRKMPSFEYQAYARPTHIEKPQYRPAIIAVFGASRLVVVKDDDDAHMDTLNKARQSGIQTDEVDE